jgi:hypothetical protein
MKTKYLINYLIVIFTFIFASHSKGQSLAVSLNSPYICFGSQLNLNATLTGTPTGVIATNCTFDFKKHGKESLQKCMIRTVGEKIERI